MTSAILIVVFTIEHGFESEVFNTEADAIKYADELSLMAAYRNLNVQCARVHVSLANLASFHQTKEG